MHMKSHAVELIERVSIERSLTLTYAWQIHTHVCTSGFFKCIQTTLDNLCYAKYTVLSDTK